MFGFFKPHLCLSLQGAKNSKKRHKCKERNGNKYENTFSLTIDSTSLLSDEINSEVISIKFGGEISSSENESSGGSTIVSDVKVDYSKCSDKSALDGGSGAVLSTGYSFFALSISILDITSNWHTS